MVLPARAVTESSMATGGSSIPLLSIRGASSLPVPSPAPAAGPTSPDPVSWAWPWASYVGRRRVLADVVDPEAVHDPGVLALRVVEPDQVGGRGDGQVRAGTHRDCRIRVHFSAVEVDPLDVVGVADDHGCVARDRQLVGLLDVHAGDRERVCRSWFCRRMSACCRHRARRMVRRRWAPAARPRWRWGWNRPAHRRRRANGWCGWRCRTRRPATRRW